jgi:hypothetical protein
VSIVKKIRLKIKVVKIGKEEEMMKVWNDCILNLIYIFDYFCY